MIQETVFGPINSRRFGTSLGVDLSPNLKQCNFDCLYCELKQEKKRVELQTNPVVLSKILREIETTLEKFDNIDVLTFTANGEPTLYPDLDNLIAQVNKFKARYNLETLILSNSGNIWYPDIRNTLMKFDKVKLSLDCATQNCFEKIDRPIDGITIDAIKTGISEFAQKFQGELFIEILFLEHINAKSDEVAELNKFLLTLPKVTRIDIGTVERPPAYDVKPLSYNALLEISQDFDKDLPILISKHREKKSDTRYLVESEILHILRLRPLTKYDFESLFDNETIDNLERLLEDDLVEIKKVGDIEFYQPSKSLEATNL